MTRYFIFVIFMFLFAFSKITFAASPQESIHTEHQASSDIKNTETDVEGKINGILQKLTPAEESALEKKIQDQKQAAKNPFAVLLFYPNYILPYYYTFNPDQAIYVGNTPDDQKIKNQEFKGQFSILIPLVSNLFHRKTLSLNMAYTQLMYWQFYATSQYFRETNYMPEVFLEDHFFRNWLFRFGVVHQSNGRGGKLERSWNRAFSTLQLSSSHWLVGLRVWTLIFTRQSSDLHNPDIAHFLGHENVLVSYKFHRAVFSLQMQNLESLLRRGYIKGTISYPINKRVKVYFQYFSGYGQSLIEYDHRTKAAGIGIAFNDWI